MGQDWYRQTIELVCRINDAAGNDGDAFDKAVAELRQLTHRKHDALQNVIKILNEPLYSGQPDKEE